MKMTMHSLSCLPTKIRQYAEEAKTERMAEFTAPDNSEFLESFSKEIQAKLQLPIEDARLTSFIKDSVKAVFVS